MSELSLVLKRIYHSSDRTIGVMEVGDELMYTMEPAGPDSSEEGSNKRIPVGEYCVEPYSSKKYPDSYELKDVEGRTAILIHAGNLPSDTKGCILVGLDRAVYKGDQAITRSRDAIKVLFNTFKQYDKVTIKVKC
jgi:hypothetical protein